ncbi:MAG: glycosyltransferase family 2 protein [Verrucomicrobiales bacterium]|nr:glycosyltransferase family 2 protein [Verrucomicrobiales bacterium]
MAKNANTEIRVHVYVLCWNEAVILPHFLRHYAFAEKIVVFDNGSDDGSQEIVEAAGNAELRSFDTEGELNDHSYLQIKNEVWKESRGQADFVVVCDMDEFLYHPDLPEVLREMKRREATVLMPKGYEMVGEQEPGSDEDLLDCIREGMRLHVYDKCLLFDPNAVEQIDYEIGCHVCHPQGRVAYFRVPGLMLLHYKHLSPDYVWARYEVYRARMTQESIRSGNAPHYQISRERLQARYERMRGGSVDVIALAEEKSQQGQCLQEAVDLSDAREHAMEAFARGDLDRAYGWLEYFSDWRPGHYLVHASLAVVFAKRVVEDRYDAAVQKAMNVVESDYSLQRAVVLAEAQLANVEGLLQVARTVNSAGCWHLGLPCLLKAHRLQPERVDILMRLAYANNKRGDKVAALNFCEQVMEKRPEELAVHELAVTLLRELGRGSDAERMLELLRKLKQGE